MKIKCKFTNQQLEDLWSALTVWQDKLDKQKDTETAEDIKKLIKKVRKYLGHKNL